MPTITETLKQKVEELELERHLNEAVAAGEQALRQAITKAGDYAHSNRDKAEAFLDKTAATIDEKTEGRYADQVKKVADQVKLGVTKLADHRASDTEPADVTPEAPTTEAAAKADAPKAKSIMDEPTKFDWDAVTDDV